MSRSTTIHQEFHGERSTTIRGITVEKGPHYKCGQDDSMKRVRDDEVMGWGYLIRDTMGTSLLGPAKYLKWTLVGSVSLTERPHKYFFNFTVDERGYTVLAV